MGFPGITEEGKAITQIDGWHVREQSLEEWVELFRWTGNQKFEDNESHWKQGIEREEGISWEEGASPLSRPPLSPTPEQRAEAIRVQSSKDNASLWSTGCAGLLGAHSKRLEVPKLMFLSSDANPPCAQHPSEWLPVLSDTYTILKLMPLTVPLVRKSSVSDPGDLWLLRASMKLWQESFVSLWAGYNLDHSLFLTNGQWIDLLGEIGNRREWNRKCRRWCVRFCGWT